MNIVPTCTQLTQLQQASGQPARAHQHLEWHIHFWLGASSSKVRTGLMRGLATLHGLPPRADPGNIMAPCPCPDERKENATRSRTTVQFCMSLYAPTLRRVLRPVATGRDGSCCIQGAPKGSKQMTSQMTAAADRCHTRCRHFFCHR